MSQLIAIRPRGMAPEGIDPKIWRKAMHLRIRQLLDQAHALLDALDDMDVDPDFEEPGDREPWLGWTGDGRGTVGLDTAIPHDADLESELGIPGTYTDGGIQYDLEQDGADAEPSLGAPEWHPDGRLWDGHIRGSQLEWAAGTGDDREYECEDEGAACDDEGALEQDAPHYLIPGGGELVAT